MQSAQDSHINLAVSLNALLEDATRKKIKIILERVRDIYDAPHQSWVWFVPYYLLGLRSRTADINLAINALDKTQKPAIEIINQLFSIGNWKETSVNTLLMREFIVELNKSKNVLPPHELQLINLLLTMAQKIKVQLQLKELETVRCERNNELAIISQESSAKKARESLMQSKIVLDLKPKAPRKELSAQQIAFAKVLEQKLLIHPPKISVKPKNVLVIDDYNQQSAFDEEVKRLNAINIVEPKQSDDFKKKAAMLSQLFGARVEKQEKPANQTMRK